MKIATFHTPPCNQGQTVEVSYTMIDGVVIRRIFDRGGRTMVYAISPAELDDQGDYWNDEPSNSCWRQASASELNAMFAVEYDVAF